MKRLVQRILLLGAGLLPAILAGELLVRALKLGDATLDRGTLHAYDPDAGWICRPGANVYYELPGSFRVRVLCNTRGLRDRERPFEKPAGTRRIVCLGDSYLWGYGVENDETLPANLEQLLPGVEAINLGANGYSTVQKLVRLETEGLRYDPDWVVLLFCWNDLEDNFDDKKGGRPVAEWSSDGVVRIVNRPVRSPWKPALAQWMAHHSRLYLYVAYRIKLARDAILRSRAEARPAPTGAAGAGADQMKFSEVSFYLGEARPALNRAWETLRQLLVMVRDLAARHDARLLVVHVADQRDVDPVAQHELIRETGQPAGAFDWDRTGRTLMEMCAGEGIESVDLAPAFRAQPDPSALFLKRNRHWNAAGQRLAAEVVAGRLQELADGFQ
jgi:lysophospholipase L1-like esterase